MAAVDPSQIASRDDASETTAPPSTASLRSWLLRLITWDGALPGIMWAVPFLVRVLIPNTRWAIEFTAIFLPITAFLVRYQVGRRSISSNECGIVVRRLQLTAFCLGIAVLVLIDAILMLCHVMPKGELFATPADLMVWAALYGAYLTAMAFAMYPGAARMHVIETSRLTLEPQVSAHADEMFVVLCDPAIYEYENEPPPSAEWLRERFTRLEARRSPDGREQWLNWVIRLRTSELIGYVQATVYSNGRAAIAYEISSKFWGRGLAREAVEAMIAELVAPHSVRVLSAVAKRKNHRSQRLLERLGFSLASPELHAECQVEPDELLMCREVQSA